MRRDIEIFASRKANVWNIGTVASMPRPCIYHQGLRNIAVVGERKRYCISLIESSGQLPILLEVNMEQPPARESTRPPMARRVP